MLLPVCPNVHVSSGVGEDQKRPLYPLELELPEIVSCLAWMLRSELWSCVRAARNLTYWVTFPTTLVIFASLYITFILIPGSWNHWDCNQDYISPNLEHCSSFYTLYFLCLPMVLNQQEKFSSCSLKHRALSHLKTSKTNKDCYL